MQFSDLALSDKLLSVLKNEGYTSPTAIQQKAIPHVLAGRDLVGLAQTGTGKTAAFALPIIELLSKQPIPRPRHIRVLVLAPTRELAAQIEQSFATYGQGSGLKQTVIFGGVGQGRQVDAIRSGLDVLVATPGRLLDLSSQGLLDLKRLEYFVIDEADRMLDMGFIHDVRRVIKLLPARKQTLFFSATMPPEVRNLADVLLKNPATVEVHPVSSTVDRIDQSLYFVEKNQKRFLLLHLVQNDPKLQRALVFTRTKHLANRVAEFLSKSGEEAMAIHGNKSQGARERALAAFVAGDIRVLVATDIAARGIDVEGVTHVFNFDLPEVPETYVHRIGRTARAGASGKAVAFCSPDERGLLRDIERLIRKEIPRAGEHPFHGEAPALERPLSERLAGGGRGAGQRQRSGTGGGRSGAARSGQGRRPGRGAQSSGSAQPQSTAGSRQPRAQRSGEERKGQERSGQRNNPGGRGVGETGRSQARTPPSNRQPRGR